MTPDELDRLTQFKQFPASARELVAVAGLTGAAALITAWGGQEFPVPPRDTRNAIGQANLARLTAVLAQAGCDNVVEAIIDHWGGQMLYIPIMKEVLQARAKDDLRDQYQTLIRKGYTHAEAVFELGVTWHVTGRAIEKALAGSTKAKKHPQTDERQQSFPFDELYAVFCPQRK